VARRCGTAKDGGEFVAVLGVEMMRECISWPIDVTRKSLKAIEQNIINYAYTQLHLVHVCETH
jgi:hypothetical protein